jgi:hypothetical protein
MKSTTERPWPDYLPLPHEDILAIGVIALNYCQLENMFRVLFSSVTRLNEHQTQALFHRLANNIRKDVLSDLLAKTMLPDELRDPIKYFLEGFGQCAENRHLIMHSASAGLHHSQDKSGLVLERHTRAGNALICLLTLEDLKRIANDINDYTGFGAWVATDADGYANHIESKKPGTFKISLPTLNERPPAPIRLGWQSPPVTKAQRLPAAALHLLSPFQIRDEDS